MSRTTRAPHEPVTEFRHEAMLYRGRDELVAMLMPVIRSGIGAGDSILVALDVDAAARLRAALGADASLVTFVDMRSVGRNPARIIPVWTSFVDEHADHGRGALGIGEPVWPGRSDDELEECELHESLLNVAFAGGPAWRLVCPYDVLHLSEGAIRTAFDTHPVVPGFPASADPVRLAGIPSRFRTPVRYGGGGATLRLWQTGGALVCEVRDRGHIEDPLVGRFLPQPMAEGRRGLWLVNQLCDLVQLRSPDSGVVVRLHAALAA